MRHFLCLLRFLLLVISCNRSSMIGSLISQAKFGRPATCHCGKRWNCWADGRSWTPDGVRPTSAWRHFWAACAVITIKECWSSNGSVPMTRTLQSTSFRWGPIKQLVHPQLLFEHGIFLSRGHTRPKRRRQPHFPVSCLCSFRFVFSFDIVPHLWWIFNNFSGEKKGSGYLCLAESSHLQLNFSLQSSEIPLFYPSVKFFWALLKVGDLKPLNRVTKSIPIFEKKPMTIQGRALQDGKFQNMIRK